jgi:hypothetical protein
MKLISKVKIGNELYVYFLNKLIYKRWIGNKMGKVFHDGEGLT